MDLSWPIAPEPWRGFQLGISELTSRERHPEETVNDKCGPSKRFCYQVSAEASLPPGPIFSHRERWYLSIHERPSHDLSHVLTMRCIFHPETPRNLQVPELRRFPIQECCKLPEFNPKNPTLSSRGGKSHEKSPIIPSGITGLFSWFWSKYSDKEHLVIRIHLFNTKYVNSWESYSTLPKTEVKDVMTWSGQNGVGGQG